MGHLEWRINGSEIDCCFGQRRGFGALGHRREIGVHIIGHFLKLRFGQMAFGD
jgi:hypothetical protein